MDRLPRFLAAISMSACAAMVAPSVRAEGPCHGRFPDLVTDICWACVFPISIGPTSIDHGQEDNGPSPPLVCECPAPPPEFVRFGVGIGYWEPTWISESVRTPFCSPTLDGATLADFPAPSGTHAGQDKLAEGAFYQVHLFSFPILSWIGASFGSAACRSHEGFDLIYMTELDPAWADDELAFLLNPEAVLFQSLPTQAACMADTSAATDGFGIDALFWCSGSQGSVYPIAGTSAHHVGGVDTSMLETHRLLFKLHRQMLALDTSTIGAMCQPRPQPTMRKGQYKLTTLYPVAKTDRAVPFGRPTADWVAGHEFPYEGEDFTQLVWRKRLCCAL